MSDGTTFDDELLEELEKLRQEIGQLRRAEHELLERNGDLAALTSIATAVNRSLELQEVVDIAVEKTLDALNIEAGLVCLLDPASSTYIPASYRNVSDNIVEALTGVTAGKGLPGMVELAGEPLIIPDLSEVDDHELPSAIDSGLTFFAGIPIRGEGGLLGVLVLLDSRLRQYSTERLDMLADIGDQVGRAVSNARTFRLTKQQIVERMVGEQQRVRLVKQLQEQVSELNDLLDALPSGLILLDGERRVVVSNNAADELLEALIDDEEEDTLSTLGGVDVATIVAADDGTEAGRIEVEGVAYALHCHRPDDEDEARRVLELRPCGSSPAAAADDGAPASEAPATPPSGPAPTADTGPDVITGLSNHLDTALSVIGLYAGMSLTADLPAKVSERLQIVCDEALRAEQIIRTLMDACQVAAYTRRPLNLDDLVRELTGELGLRLPDDINLELVYAGDVFPVEGDPAALRQVLLNLAANAQRAMPSGGQLRIALRHIDQSTPPEARWPGLGDGNWIQMTVTDEGTGIDPSILPRIFEPFFTTEDAATGLGLAQVQGIITQHGGHIDVVTEVGTGTTFAVHLPALATDEPVDRPSPGLPRASSPDQGILVVASDPSLRSGLAEALRDLGYTVTEAADDDEASHHLAETGDGILLALMEAPDADQAKDRLARLRDTAPDLRAVLLSRIATDFRALDEGGWNGWLPWPPQLDQLAHTVADSLG